MRRQLKGHFWSVAKVALRFGCTKQSKNLEWYLLGTYLVVDLYEKPVKLLYNVRWYLLLPEG